MIVWILFVLIQLRGEHRPGTVSLFA